MPGLLLAANSAHQAVRGILRWASHPVQAPPGPGELLAGIPAARDGGTQVERKLPGSGMGPRGGDILGLQRLLEELRRGKVGRDTRAESWCGLPMSVRGSEEASSPLARRAQRDAQASRERAGPEVGEWAGVGVRLRGSFHLGPGGRRLSLEQL